MPYIKQEDRQRFDDALDAVPSFDSKGELEYAVTVLMHIFMYSRAERYATLHDCVYAVQHAADEFRRQRLDKREDAAIAANGDVKAPE